MLWLWVACSQEIKTAQECPSAEEVLEEEIWPIVAGDCLSCHQEGGEAAQTFFILSGEEPTDENLELVRMIATQKLPNMDRYLMEQKAQGFLNHGGGLRFPAFGEEYKKIRAYIALATQGTCEEECIGTTTEGNTLKRLTPEQLENTIQSVFDISISYPKRYSQEAQPWHEIYDQEELVFLVNVA